MSIDAKTSDLIDLLGFAPDSLSALAVKTALLRVHNEALEEAAKVAEGSEVDSCCVDDMEEVSARNLACYDIATAIRALKGET